MDDLLLVAIIVAVIGLLLLPQIFFLLTLQKALSRCSPRNRTMSPGLVWLDLIPILNLVWQFITVIRVAESLKNEFRDRGMHRRKEDYGNGLGLAACCALAVVGLPGLVVWIIYWAKIANLSAQIAYPASDYDDDDYDGYYHDDDDRPRRRRRDDYDDEEEDERPRSRRRRDRDDDEDDRDERDERKPWDRGR